MPSPPRPAWPLSLLRVTPGPAWARSLRRRGAMRRRMSRLIVLSPRWARLAPVNTPLTHRLPPDDPLCSHTSLRVDVLSPWGCSPCLHCAALHCTLHKVATPSTQVSPTRLHLLLGENPTLQSNPQTHLLSAELGKPTLSPSLRRSRRRLYESTLGTYNDRASLILVN